MHVKGAPDVLLARASRFMSATGDAPLDGPARAAFETENARLRWPGNARAGSRTPRHSAARLRRVADLMPWAQQLSLVGLVGIFDPPRPEARDAIVLCKQAGIQVKIFVTGDHALTAAAIARELGLHGAVLTGTELDRIDVAELSRHIEETAVFARVAPQHKVKIVQALKARGHVVAMTGDGVNDAPAFKDRRHRHCHGYHRHRGAKEAADDGAG